MFCRLLRLQHRFHLFLRVHHRLAQACRQKIDDGLQDCRVIVLIQCIQNGDWLIDEILGQPVEGEAAVADCVLKT